MKTIGEPPNPDLQIMTNDPAARDQMTKGARMTKDEAVCRASDFGIRVSSFFRHSSFVIRASAGACLALLALAPQKALAQVNNVNTVGTAFVFPVPQQIELGPVLDVIPYVLSDGFTVNLTIIPTLTEFVGYDNPNSVLPPGTLTPIPGAVLVPTILPRFRVRQVVSTVNIWDGQTVALGGLISENVISLKDKIPVLGDIPFVGRFFRSESKNTQKKNLIIFVTPTIIDPAGNRMHSEDEMPFAQASFPAQPPAAIAGPAPVPAAAPKK